MNDNDDHVIPYEEAVRRHRAIEEAQRSEKSGIHEVKMSDAMTHLLEDGESPHDEGPTPTTLRHIVEREFADEGVQAGTGPRERPRPHLVEDPQPEQRGQLCDFATRRCEDPPHPADDPTRR